MIKKQNGAILILLVLLAWLPAAFAAQIEDEVKKEADAYDSVPVVIMLGDASSGIFNSKEISALNLNLRDSSEFEITHQYKNTNMVAGKLTKIGLEKLKKNPNVNAVYFDREFHAMLDASVPLINAPLAHSYQLDNINITGEGQTVCIIDTGVDYTNPALGSCLSEFQNINYSRAAIICQDSPCIANESLIMSRDTISPLPEPNHPNTIDYNCDDGPAGTYLNDESIESINITDLSNPSFSPGDAVNVVIKTYCYSNSDYLNIAYQSELRNFTVLQSFQCSGAGFEVFSASFNLDSVEGYHIIRGVFQFGTNAPNICGKGSYDDNDDVIIMVNRPTPPPEQASDCKVIGGYDFVNDDYNPIDDNGHGTHVAGIVASNDENYRGVAPGAKIVAVKVLNSYGTGSFSDVLAGIDWCVANAPLFNISVITMSLGDSSAHDEPCDGTPDAVSINNAVANGIFVSAASGNDYYTNGISSPACVSNATSVGATDDNDNIADFSNTGSILDILAPGVDIMSTVLSGNFAEISGTSMATPHVAGAAALLKQFKKLEKGIDISPSEITNALKSAGIGIMDPDNSLVFPRIDIWSSIILLNIAPWISESITPDISTAAIDVVSDEYTNASLYYGAALPFTFRMDSAEFSRQHRFALANLNPGSIYYYQITVCDALGACNTSEIKSFSTLSASASPEKKKEDFRIERLSFNDEVLEQGESLVTTANIRNTGTKSSNTARLTVIIPELGERKSAGPFHLDDGDEITKQLLLELPGDVPAGEYIVRITASSDKERRVKHRYIEIV